MCKTQTWRRWGSKILGCSVVLQTRWRMVVLPALARPMIRTRKRRVLLRKFLARIFCLSGSTNPAGWVSIFDWLISRSGAWDGVTVLDNGSGRDECVPSISILDWHTSWSGAWDGVTVLDHRMMEMSAHLRIPLLVFLELSGFWSSKNVAYWAFFSTFFLLMMVVSSGNESKDAASYCLACSALHNMMELLVGGWNFSTAFSSLRSLCPILLPQLIMNLLSMLLSD